MGQENILTQKEKAIVKEAVKAYRDTILDEEKNVDKILAKNIRKMLTNYRRTKAKLADEAVLTKEEERELRYECIKDLMGNVDQQLMKSERRIMRNEEERRMELFKIKQLERAVEMYKKECDESSSYEDLRRCREIYGLYIDKEKKSVSEIAEEERISEKTAYKDVSVACKIIAVYYF